MEDQVTGQAPFFGILRLSRGRTFFWAASLICAIGITDWKSADDVPLGFLYLLPMLMLGRTLRPWQTLIAASLCTSLTEIFDPFPWNLRTGLPRDVLYFIAFFAIGAFVYQADRNRRIAAEQMREIEMQSAARFEAEQQLALLIETSPAAIITTDAAGLIVMANEAAYLLFDLPRGTLVGSLLHDHIPLLQRVLQRDAGKLTSKAVLQARGQRENGEAFLAEVCVSSYGTSTGKRFTAMILDASEELRSREESSLRQVLAGSRIAVSAISHEIRNVCGAVAVVHRNLAAAGRLGYDKDFEALGNLVTALERIAAVELKPYPEQLAQVDLEAVLEDLRIVITPSLQEEEIALRWEVHPDLPLVWADGTNLMQLFLNLVTNSIRQLSDKVQAPVLTVKAAGKGARVLIEIVDNGGGVKDTATLFRPFQANAQQTGLGLYLARAFARSFGGEVHHQPVPGGASFIVELLAVTDSLT